MSGRIERERQADLAGTVDRTTFDPDGGTAGTVAVTFTEGTYPTTAATAYACRPVVLDGDETEGAEPTLTADDTVTLYATNLGTAIPPSGSYLILAAVGGRWVFRWDATA